MECAGNVRQAKFGLLSVGEWAGVPVSEILDKAKAKSGTARVLISGFDRYATESRTSIPGASWAFSPEQLEKAGAFLATELNGQPLPKDHGAPRSEEHTSELQSRLHLVCRLLLEKKK